MSLHSHSSLSLVPFALHISKVAMDSSRPMTPSQASPMPIQHSTGVEVDAPPVPDANIQTSKIPEKTRERSVATADNDVQILFSVPRRRKKKRKRYGMDIGCS